MMHAPATLETPETPELLNTKSGFVNSIREKPNSIGCRRLTHEDGRLIESIIDAIRLNNANGGNMVLISKEDILSDPYASVVWFDGNDWIGHVRMTLVSNDPLLYEMGSLIIHPRMKRNPKAVVTLFLDIGNLWKTYPFYAISSDKLVKLLLEKSNVFAGELYTDTLPPKLDAIINAVQAIGPTDRIIVTQRVLHGIIDGKYDVDKEEAVS